MTKKQAWDYATGMLRVDGLEPSRDMLEMIEKEIKGEMTTDEIRAILIEKYKKRKSSVDESKYRSIY